MDIKTPFELINILGTSTYNDVSTIDKKRNSFIVNRMLSRAFPDIAMNVSHLGLSSDIAVDYWNLALTELKTSKLQGHKNIVGYLKKVMYISMSTQKDKVKSKIDKEVAREYINISKISKKEFDILVRFFEDDLIKYLKSFEKMIKTTNNE